MYEELTQIVRNLLDYRPNEPHKLFEELSKKRELSIDNQTDSYSFAQRQLTILSV